MPRALCSTLYHEDGAVQSCKAREGFEPTAAGTKAIAIQQALSAVSGRVVPIYASAVVPIFKEEHELAKVGLRHPDWQLAAKLAHVQHPRFSNAWGYKRVVVTKLCNVGARPCVKWSIHTQSIASLVSLFVKLSACTEHCES